jgi:hypothetical protein
MDLENLNRFTETFTAVAARRCQHLEALMIYLTNQKLKSDWGVFRESGFLRMTFAEVTAKHLLKVWNSFAKRCFVDFEGFLRARFADYKFNSITTKFTKHT